MSFRPQGPVCDLLSHRRHREISFTRVDFHAPCLRFGNYSSTMKPTVDFDVKAAVQFAGANACAKSTGKCARYVMAAIARGFGALEANASAATVSASSSVEKIASVRDLGAPISVPVSAKFYGPVLEHLGFSVIDSEKAGAKDPKKRTFDVGVVAIIQATKDHVHGHIQIYGGKHWISDFEQNDPFWPNTDLASTWQTEKPAFSIYQFPKSSSYAH